MQAVLEVTAGPHTGRKIVLSPGIPVRIGRTAKADYVVAEDTFLSGAHFYVECSGETCLVRDLGSSNGTLLNGERISEGQVREGDTITAGQSSFALRLDPLGGAAAHEPAVPLDDTRPMRSPVYKDLFPAPPGADPGQPFAAPPPAGPPPFGPPQYNPPPFGSDSPFGGQPQFNAPSYNAPPPPFGNDPQFGGQPQFGASPYNAPPPPNPPPFGSDPQFGGQPQFGASPYNAPPPPNPPPFGSDPQFGGQPQFSAPPYNAPPPSNPPPFGSDPQFGGQPQFSAPPYNSPPPPNPPPSGNAPQFGGQPQFSAPPYNAPPPANPPPFGNDPQFGGQPQFSAPPYNVPPPANPPPFGNDPQFGGQPAFGAPGSYNAPPPAPPPFGDSSPFGGPPQFGAPPAGSPPPSFLNSPPSPAPFGDSSPFGPPPPAPPPFGDQSFSAPPAFAPAPPPPSQSTFQPLERPPSEPKGLQSALVETLRGLADPIFALLDRSLAGSFVDAARASEEPVESMSDDAGLCLVAVNPESRLADQFASDGWGKSWGILLTSRQSIKMVRNHLRRFQTVMTADGAEFQFRLARPELMRAFLPTLNGEEAKTFFGPVTAILTEGLTADDLILFMPSSRGAIQKAIALAAGNVAAV